jgi:ABC-type polysaccharide/polyol phosphate transport system ATPase subunit
MTGTQLVGGMETIGGHRQASGPAVSAQGLGKRFRLYAKPLHRLLDLFSKTPRRATEIWALRDLTFDIERGECFAIIGTNGSGKSTLLKLLTGTLLPTTGEARVNGRVLALLELGAGMNPELTGRENVIASASLLGFPADYGRKRIAEIEAFADVGEFFDRPMRIYSSGMFVRVAFATYIFMQPDVFIVDEALSVGDVFFQQKCFAAIERMKAAGTTIIFVSHDTGAVQGLCDRALLLEGGRPQFIGKPDEVVNRYHSSLGRKLASSRNEGAEARIETPQSDPAPVVQQPAEAVVAPGRPGATTLQKAIERIEAASLLQNGPVLLADGSMALIAAACLDRNGAATTAVRIGTRLNFEAVIEARCDVADPDCTLTIFNRFGEPLFGFGAALSGEASKPLDAGKKAVVRFSVDLDVAVGHYTFAFDARRRSQSPAASPAAPHMLGPLFVFWDRSTSPFYGVAKLKVDLEAADTAA